MSIFDKLDRLANAAAGSLMPDEHHARASTQSQTTNARNQLAQVANGFGVSRAAKRAAHAQLVREVGDREAQKLMKDAVRKIRDTF